MGDESISRPPAAKNAAMTSAHCARAGASWPTLKVIQVPRPTNGSCSPLDGIARASGAGCANRPPAASRGGNCSRVRRFMVTAG